MTSVLVTGESKLFVERSLYWYSQAYGIRRVALRYFNATGADLEGELGEEHHPEPHLIPRVIEAALGERPHLEIYGTDYPTPDGTATRDYIHVTDLAEAHARALRSYKISRFGYARKLIARGRRRDISQSSPNEDALAAKVRAMKNFGFCGQGETVAVGTNGNMSEVSTATGLTCLESLEELVTVNHRNYQRSLAELADLAGKRFMTFDEVKCDYQYIVLEGDETVAPISRDVLLQVLHAENVFARQYFYPGCHRVKPYRSLSPHRGSALPVTEMLANRILVLPTGRPWWLRKWLTSARSCGPRFSTMNRLKNDF